jgi:hypothetical protein
MNQRKSKSKSISHTKEHETNSRQHITKKDQNAQRSQLLQLAMDWDCIDVAKEFILQNSLDNILVKIFNEEYLIKYFCFSFLEQRKSFFICIEKRFTNIYL